MPDAPIPHHPPSVDRVLNWPSVAPLLAEYGRPAVLAAVRGLLEELRQPVQNGEANGPALPSQPFPAG